MTTTSESFTNGSNNVEYFLLEPNNNSNSKTTEIINSPREILSPIPYRDEAAIDASERICFDEDLTIPTNYDYNNGTNNSDDDDDVEALLSPTSLNHTTSRYSIRSARRNNNNRELSGINYLNFITYVVHVFVWWGIGVWGLNGLISTHWEITERYVTLITPATWSANYLWIPILLLEAIFTIAQLLPYYRSRPIVTSGTGYYFFYTVLLQIIHTLLYSFRLFIFSFIIAILALISLLALLSSQQNHGRTLSASGRRRRSNVTEYCLFCLPFYLHTGWMILMIIDHFSLLFRRYSADDIGLQLACDIVSLGILLPVAIYALTRSSGPDYVISGVILWSYIGIACRLQNPNIIIIELYGKLIIRAVLIATYFFIGIISSCIIPFAIVTLSREFCTINVVELD